MHLALQNPFDSGAFTTVTATDEAVASLRQVDDATADIPLFELEQRGFDAEAFLNDCEALPAFLAAPSQQYLSATNLIPVLEVLAGH